MMITVKSIDSKDPSDFQSDVETELINIGKWAIKSMKVPGYFPFNIESLTCYKQQPDKPCEHFNKHIYNPGIQIPRSPSSILIKMKRLSLFSLKCDFNIFYMFVWFLVGIYLDVFASWLSLSNLSQLSSDNRVFSDTSDRFIYTYNGLCIAFIGTYFRIHFLVNCRKYLEFWKETVGLLQKVDKLGSPSSSPPLSNTPFFKLIMSETRFTAVVCWCLSLSQTLFIYFVVVFFPQSIHVVVDDPYVQSLIHLCGLIVIHSHIGLVVWLMFYMKIFKACYQTISWHLRETITNDSRNSWKDFDGRRQSDKIQKLMEVFELVSEKVEGFNKLYGLPLVVEVCICASNLLAGVYCVNKFFFDMDRLSMAENVSVGGRIPAQLTYLVRLWLISGQGGSVTWEALQVVQLLKRIDVPHFGDSFQTKVHMLVTRVSLHPPIISPQGFFSISYRLLVSILSLLVTYCLVLVEFREEDEGRSIIKSLNLSCIH